MSSIVGPKAKAYVQLSIYTSPDIDLLYSDSMSINM